MNLSPVELFVMLCAVLLQYGWIVILAVILYVLVRRRNKG